MPLSAGSDRKTISKNIREMRDAGHPQDQAVAASLSNARKSRASRKSKRKGRSSSRRGRG